MRAAFRFLSRAALLLAPVLAQAAEPHVLTGRFLGENSCRTSGCHAGGEGKGQCLIWEKKDVHARAQAILGNARATRITEALGLTTEAAKEARCNVCHSPFQAVPESRFAGAVPPEKGVSCESCHGPAEGWIRFHTRPDLSREQRLSAGMREMRDLYHRANTCVACHLYVEPELIRAGHPEMTFELAAQMKNEPPHWRLDPDAWADGRAWLTGQAASLRELSWKAASVPDDDLRTRQAGLLWMLRLTTLGQTQLPEHGEPAAVQQAADRLARAAGQSTWTRESTLAQLRRFAQANESFRAENVPQPEQRRRAEALTVGIERLWLMLKASGLASPTLETAFGIAAGEAKTKGNFQAARFAAALQQVEVALEQLRPAKE